MSAYSWPLAVLATCLFLIALYFLAVHPPTRKYLGRNLPLEVQSRKIGLLILIIGLIANAAVKYSGNSATENDWGYEFLSDFIMSISTAIGAAFISHGFLSSRTTHNDTNEKENSNV